MFSEKLLRAMWPRGDEQSPGLVAAIAAQAPAIFAKHGFDTPLTVAHAMAQFTVECGGGHEMTESIEYTPERAAVVWHKRFTSADDCLQKVGSFRGDPKFKFKLIDMVYGGRNGNTQPHDGSTYIGRGLSQVTGRGNYKDLAAKLGNGLDLEGTPDLVIRAANALECGLADLVMCGCLPHAKADDLLGVSALLNTGHLTSNPADVVGFDDRKAALQLWKLALGVTKPPLHSAAWVQVSLNTLGADPQLVPDGSFGGKSKTALKAFQGSHGLPVDGQITPQTLAAIDQALAAIPVA
jgi:putative chitinase